MKELTKILEIPESCPPDFYKNPEYLAQVKTALETAKSLVHSIDDEGRTKAKADAAAIRKYVKTTNSFTKTVFDTLTGKVKVWRDQFASETKQLSDAADGILSKFDEMEKAKLKEVEGTVRQALSEKRVAIGVKDVFITSPDLTPIIKLSGTLTPGGKLTSSAMQFITNIVSAEFASEQQYELRCNILKIKSLENGINPPLHQDYLGASFFANDDEFDAKLNHLIGIEITRREALEKKHEADKQAAAEKVEADKKRALEVAEEGKQKAVQAALFEQLELQGNKQAAEAPAPTAETNKELFKNRLNDGVRTLQYALVIEAKVKPETTDEMFMNMVKANFSEKLQKAIIHENLKNVD